MQPSGKHSAIVPIIAALLLGLAAGARGQNIFCGTSSNTCGLWLSIAASNTTAMLTLHNTRPSERYYVWSAQEPDVTFTNWGLEATALGAAGDTTETNIAMGSRSNLFFRVTKASNTIFQGLSFADTRAGNPDSMGAVGPSYFCELLNGATNTSTTAFAAYDKSSGTNLAHTNLGGFFAVHDADGTDYPTGLMGDPRIIFDSQSQCFVASAIDELSKQVILAVCTNANNATNLATGWSRYVLHVAKEGVDTASDRLGLDANGVYLSVVHRGEPQGTNAGHTIVAIKKPDIYLGTNISTCLTNNNDLNLWTLQPAVNFDTVPSSGYAWFVAKGPPTLSGRYQGGGIVYRRLQWSGTNADWADTNWFAVSTSTDYRDYYDLDGTNTIVTATTNGISAAQTNGFVPLYLVGSRVSDAFIRNGFLWTCQAIGLSGTNGTYHGDPSGSNVTRSGVQWLKLEISPDNASLALADHGRVFDSAATNAMWYYMPSLMVNCAGDMVSGFSGSSSNCYIGAFYTWRLSSGATLDRPGLIQAGTVTFLGSKWGDYSATTLDPMDDWSFWTVQEYATQVQGPVGPVNRWATAIARIRAGP